MNLYLVKSKPNLDHFPSPNDLMNIDFFFDIETAKDENGYSTIQDVRTAITSIAYYDKAGKDRRVLVLDEQKLSPTIIILLFILLTIFAKPFF